MRHVELKVLGDAIRQLRLAHSLTAEQLAEKCGLHRTYISDVERGARNVTYLTLQRMAHALDTTVSDLTYNFEFAASRHPKPGLRPGAHLGQRNGRRRPKA
jgi:transcriptional regulator with XRE-family HTH domain